MPGLLSASLVFPHSAPGASDERLAPVAPGGRAEDQERLRGEESPPAWLWRPDLSEPEGRPLWAPVRGVPSGLLLGAIPPEPSPPRPSRADRLRGGGRSRPATEGEGLGLQAPAWNPVP